MPGNSHAMGSPEGCLTWVVMCMCQTLLLRLCNPPCDPNCVTPIPLAGATVSAAFVSAAVADDNGYAVDGGSDAVHPSCPLFCSLPLLLFCPCTPLSLWLCVGVVLLRVWDAKSSWQCLKTLEGHSSAVSTVALSPDGQYAVSGSDDTINTIK